MKVSEARRGLGREERREKEGMQRAEVMGVQSRQLAVRSRPNLVHIMNFSTLRVYSETMSLRKIKERGEERLKREKLDR